MNGREESKIREGIDRAVKDVRNSPIFKGQSDTQIRERVADSVRRAERINPESIRPTPE